ncbi:F-box protein At3g07870-like [Papaver somniferum]|uniref:F-box protein At3g07870-like n=1 Tax=Papaver somniferum TaxID=3469 RepID=UPI000E7033EC|nr:F-box protein At3g07870-like [Papaver somniferum]
MMGRFDNLPKDIILDILTRLPTECVLDSKLVCKRWRDVVHLPPFSKIHLDHLKSAANDSGKLSFLFTFYDQGIKEIFYAEYDEKCHEKPLTRKTSINFDPPVRYNYYSVCSCDGLLCFTGLFNGGKRARLHYGPTCICNPITREYVILPDYEGKYRWYGFGYVVSTNEYKVVRISESGGDSNVGIIQVNTLGSGIGWRNAGMLDINMKYVRKGDGAFAGEALHWVDTKRTIILAFSLVDEKFSELPSPPPSLARASVPYLDVKLGVSGDFLSATYYNASDSDLWFFKKNKDNSDLSWSKEFGFRSHILPPFEFTKSGRLLCHENENIYTYDPKASFTKLDVSSGKAVSDAIPYKNTLVSLKVLGEKDVKTME